PAHEIPVAVDEDRVGGQSEAVDRSSGGEPLRLRHAELVAFFGAGVAHRPCPGPAGDPLEQGLPFRFSEELRVPDLVDPAVDGYHGRPDRNRTGPGAPADFVDA